MYRPDSDIPARLRSDPIISLDILVAALFVFFAFFPFIAPIPLPTDTQPYALIFGAIWVAMYIRQLTAPLSLWLLLVYPAGATLFLILIQDAFSGARDIANYVSLFVVPLCAYGVCKTYNFSLQFWLKLTVALWILLGMIQWHVDKEFGAFLLSASRTTEGRGITSFAAEPTFYGSILIIFLALWMLLGKKGKLLPLLIGFAIFYYARSASALLILVLGLAVFVVTEFISRGSVKQLIVSACIVGLVIFTAADFIEDSRVYVLATAVMDDPVVVLKTDDSVRARVGFVFASIYGSLENYLFPQGLDYVRFQDYFAVLAGRYPEFLKGLPLQTRIESGYGKVLFQFGVLGLILPLVVQFLIWKQKHLSPGERLMISVWIHGIYCSSIAAGFPLLGFFIGVSAWTRQQDQTSRRESPVSPDKDMIPESQ